MKVYTLRISEAQRKALLQAVRTDLSLAREAVKNEPHPEKRRAYRQEMTILRGVQESLRHDVEEVR